MVRLMDVLCDDDCKCQCCEEMMTGLITNGIKQLLSWLSVKRTMPCGLRVHHLALGTIDDAVMT